MLAFDSASIVKLRFFISVVGTLDSTDGLERGLDIRRYDQFEAMAQVFDPTFDNKIITDYGCNCPALGDRPLSDPGKGAPVDALDKVCQKFKRCTKCAKMEFGEECISEMVSCLIILSKMTVRNRGLNTVDPHNSDIFRGQTHSQYCGLRH